MSAESSGIDPSRVVQVTLMGVLIGIGLPTAISVTATDFSWAMLLACFGYVLQALNFFHGKVATLDDHDYAMYLRANPVVSLADYVLNMLIMVAFVVIGIVVAQPDVAPWVNAALRLVDLPLVAMGLAVSLSPAVVRAQRSWLFFNVASLAAWIVIGVTVHATGSAYQDAIIYGLAFAFIAVADITMDYTYNSKLYFQPPNGWDDFASEWNAIQGDEGDDIHHYVVMPALLNQLSSFRASTVLDIGCGNGCISRGLANAGYNVVGMDQSERMIAEAETYPDIPTLRYVVGAVEAPPPMDISFDVLIVVFTHHDVGSMDGLWNISSRLLRDDGRVVIVGEDINRATDSAVHSNSRRRWTDRKVRSGSRRQLVYWRHPDTGNVTAVTRSTYWTTESMDQSAQRNGFDLVTRISEVASVESTALAIRRYNRQPFVELSVYRRSLP